MRQIEAKWVGNRLQERPVAEISPILEIGSSSLHFRMVQKPHIHDYIHAPQMQRGVQIITSDIRAENGVDIVGDVFDPIVQQRLKEVGAKAILMCNLLEHLRDPGRFADACQSLVAPGGLIIVTVPHDYPYHLDPIDTMFRPDVAGIHALFPGTELVDSDIITDCGRWSDIRTRQGSFAASLKEVAFDVARAVTLRGGVERARSRVSGLSYLFRNYKIAAAILRVPETA